MIIHVDMSNRYYQKSFSVIAAVSVGQGNKDDKQWRQAVVIADPVRKKLLKTHSVIELHAALITMIVGDLQDIRKIIICSDVNPIGKVMSTMSEIRPGELFGRVKALDELREEMGDQKFRSAADALARKINRNFQKRHNKHRRKDFFGDGTVHIIEGIKCKEYEKLEKNLDILKKIKKTNLSGATDKHPTGWECLLHSLNRLLIGLGE